MQLGFIGLGKMGKGLVLNLRDRGHHVIAWNRSPQPLEEISQSGISTTTSLSDLVSQLKPPRVIWLMLTAGEVTEQMIFSETGIAKLLSPGDTIIDGSNGFYKDSLRHAQGLNSLHLHFIDAGISGGPSGARNGACIMVGGDKEVVTRLNPLFESICVPQGYLHCGPVGSGHFVKMVHNGIEYGMMQALGEGFEILKNSNFNLDLSAVANVYNHGSVIESRLVGWLQSGLRQYGPELEEISGTIGHLGEGKWSVETAQELGVPAPIIAGSFKFREDSKENPSFTGKVVSVLRNQFGGHHVGKADWQKSSL